MIERLRPYDQASGPTKVAWQLWWVVVLHYDPAAKLTRVAGQLWYTSRLLFLSNAQCSRRYALLFRGVWEGDCF